MELRVSATGMPILSSEESMSWGNKRSSACCSLHTRRDSPVALDKYGGKAEAFVANLLLGKLMLCIVWKVDTARQSTNIANIVTSLSQYQ